MQLAAYCKPGDRCYTGRRQIRQTFFFMRFTAIVLLAACLQVSAGTRAQSVTLSVKRASIFNVLQDIRRQTGYSFIYTDTLLAPLPPVTFSVQKAPLEKVLRLCFDNQPVGFEILDKIIVIKPVGHPADVTPVAVANIVVRGRVTDDDGNPVVASVRVKGTSRGVATNERGEFELADIDPQAVLQITGVAIDGVVEVPVNNRESLTIRVPVKVLQQKEVVVTALGLKKEKKSLTYATQEVSGEQIADSRESNIVNALQGQFSGVQIANTQGAVSSSSRIQIRGANSLSGNNQPLFVVDGVPMRNTNSRWVGYGGADYGNEIADIDLNNVASVTVLKGANAAALYGSRAANGVILITTKSANNQKGWGMTLTSNTTLQRHTYFPAYQDKYGQGSNKEYAYVDGIGGGTYDDYGGSWGPALDGRLIDQWFGKQQPWVPAPDNLKSFFQNGWIAGNDLSVARQTDKTSIRFSYGDSRQKGTLPFTDETRNTINLNASVQITDKLQSQVIVNYVRLKNNNIPTSGYTDGNIMSQMIFGGRQMNYAPMKDYQSPDGKQINTYSRLSDNPYWLYKHNTNSRIRDRFFGSARLQYEILPWMNVMVRAGLDTYSEQRNEIVNAYTAATAQAHSGGSFNLTEMNFKEFNLDAILSIDKNLADKLNLNANLGANLMNNQFRSVGLRAAELVVPNIFNIANVKGAAVPSNNYSEYEMQSVYGQLTLSYDDFLFLNGTARNDWSSTLPADNASYFYPSVGLSFLPTALLPVNLDWLDYIKLRANWAQVGNTAAPYQLVQTYTAGIGWAGNPMYQAGNVYPPTNLKPEITTSKEIGLNAQLFRKRLSFDVTMYQSNSRNQILSVQVPYSTGYSSQKVNAGNIQNKGVEVGISGTPLKRKNFSWDMGLNWSKNTNKVLELAPGITLYQIGGIWGVNSYAQEGGAYGDILGSAFLRNDAGHIVVDSRGIPKKDPVRRTLGNIMPDWVANFRTGLRYKDLSMNILFDMRKGSSIYSLGHRYGTFSGVLAATAAGDVREKGIVFDGVTEDGKKNETATEAQLFYSTANITGINEFSTFDGTYIKLREVAFNYLIPARLVKKTQFLQSATVGIAGRNLAILKSNMPKGFDPEVTTGGTDSGLGFEYGYIPTSRVFNVKIQVSF